MHQGKELRQIAERQESITLFAKDLGIVRDTLYKLFKKQTIPSKYVEKLRTMGFMLTNSYATKTDNKNNSNGVDKNTQKYLSSTRTEHPEVLSMSDMIHMSLNDLMALQKTQEDVQHVKDMQAVISYKLQFEAMQRENELLRQRISDKEEIIRGFHKK